MDSPTLKRPDSETTRARSGRVDILGCTDIGALESSYARAFRHLGFSVTHWDVPLAVKNNTRLGKFGQLVNEFWRSEPWTAKANRDLLASVLDSRPDMVFVGGSNRVTAGTLSQIKATLPECKLILIWPDPLVYCFSHVIEALPVYDLVATYSNSTVEPLKLLGGRNVVWVPLGFDPELHPPDISAGDRACRYADCDASFVGDYTPEREQIFVHLVNAGIQVKVWGPIAWKRYAKDRQKLKEYWQGGTAVAKDFCLAVKSAPLSLNPINVISFPTANMRFFEIPGCGGVPVSARCPEMRAEFPDQIGCFYYESAKTIVDVVSRVLKDHELRTRVGRAAQARVLEAHTYVHRAQLILDLLA